MLALGFLPGRFGSCMHCERPRCRTAEQRDEVATLHGADPKAKASRTKYSRCWGGSVARIAIKSRPLMSGDEVEREPAVYRQYQSMRMLRICYDPNDAFVTAIR